MTPRTRTPSHPILILAAFAHMLLGLAFFATWIGVVFLLTALAFCAVGIGTLRPTP